MEMERPRQMDCPRDWSVMRPWQWILLSFSCPLWTDEGARLLGMDGKAMSPFLFHFPMTIESSATQPWVTGPYSWWNLLRPRELVFTSSQSLWASWSHVVVWGLEGRGCRESLQSVQCFKTPCLLFQQARFPLQMAPDTQVWWVGSEEVTWRIFKWFCHGWDANILT